MGIEMNTRLVSQGKFKFIIERHLMTVCWNSAFIFSAEHWQVEAVLPGAIDGIYPYRTDTEDIIHCDGIMILVDVESITLVCDFTRNMSSSLLYLDFK